MKNGFYFNTEAIPAEYFLLKKISLIENHEKPLDLTDQEPFLYFNEIRYKFCSAFEYRQQSDFVVVFNSMSAQQMSELKENLQKNPDQKILFVPHILFDYQSVLRELMSLVGVGRILVLVDNLKHPYIVSELEMLSCGILGLNSNHFLVYTKKSMDTTANVTPQLFTFLKYSIYYFFKMILKPKQFIQDFFATYNLRFIFGKIKVFFITLFFSVRHFSVMSAIRFIYGLKVFFIRFFYWLVGTVKLTSLKLFYGVRHFFVMLPIYFRRLYYWVIEIFNKFIGLRVYLIRFYYWSVNRLNRIRDLYYYGIRHVIVMSFVHVFYGTKVFLIRSFYWISGLTKLVAIRSYFMFRHALVMLFVRGSVAVKVTLIFLYYKFLAMINYSHGALIWFYYFNKKYTFYPLRKIYWFIEFQLNKRIWKRNL